MHFSIRHKLTALMIAVVGSVILFTWFLNHMFSEKYYIAREKQSIEQTYGQVMDILDTEGGGEDHAELFERISTSTDIKMMIAYSAPWSITTEILFSNMPDGSLAYTEIIGYLDLIRNNILVGSDNSYDSEIFINPNSAFSKSIEDFVKKGYVVTSLEGKRTHEKGLYLFGVTETGFMVAMRSSMSGLQESAKISGRFLAYIGLVGTMIGSILVFFLSGSITRPIEELAKAADDISNLDFETRVNIKTGDELEALGNSVNDLSEKLKEAIVDLKKANLELQKDIEKRMELDEMRKEFLSHVSHELKTPIALIQGYAEGLRENIFDDEESKDFYCEVITDEAGKMNQMVKKLLTLNQIEFGNSELNLEHFDISQLIQNKLNASQILFKNQNIQVQYNQLDPVYVWADEYMIEEVFSNYLSNAIHHVSPNGAIRIWLQLSEKEVRVHVYNDGKPIPEEELDKLWLKFYKVDKARTREYGGSGIGLSIVAASMKAHGKDYGVKNWENGVEFYFDLDR